MTAAPGSWYEREEEEHASGRVYIRLKCADCGTELRLLKTPAGEAKAAELVAIHKPSGCCDERQAAKAS